MLAVNSTSLDPKWILDIRWFGCRRHRNKWRCAPHVFTEYTTTSSIVSTSMYLSLPIHLSVIHMSTVQNHFFYYLIDRLILSRDQILRHARGQGDIIFPVQLTTSRIGNLTRLIHTLLYVMTIHTYIHTFGILSLQLKTATT